MNETMIRLLRKKIVPAVLSVIMGIVIVIARRAALDFMVKIIGGMTILGGLAFLAIYFARADREPGALRLTVFMAAVAALIGVLLIIYAGNVVDFFPVMMGFFLILNGLSNLAESYMDHDNRLLSVLIGAASIIFGVLIVMRPGWIADAVMIWLGVFFVFNGIFDLALLHKVKRHLL